MRNVILNNIKSGLESKIGQNSSLYDDLLIEDIQNKLPDSVTVNYFVGVNISNGRNVGIEIGKVFPVICEYFCNFSILVRNADHDLGQTEVDTIFKRILKYFIDDSGTLKGLNKTEAGITESVISYKLEDFSFDEGEMKKGGLGHVCTVTLSIRTNLTT